MASRVQGDKVKNTPTSGLVSTALPQVGKGLDHGPELPELSFQELAQIPYPLGAISGPHQTAGRKFQG